MKAHSAWITAPPISMPESGSVAMLRSLRPLALAAALGLFTLLAAHPAVAQKTAPGDSCNTPEAFRPVGGPQNLGTGYFLVCDGVTDTWQAITEWDALTRRSLFQVGDDTANACNAAKEGRISYTGGDPPWEYCNGSAWVPFESAAASGGGTPSCPLSVTSGLVSRWAMDEAAGSITHDSVGGHHAAIPYSATWSPSGGVIGGALNFNGSPYGAIATGVPLLSLDQFTFCVWLNTPAGGGNVIKVGEGAGWRGFYFASWDARALESWIVTTDVSIGGGTNTVFAYNSWHHACMTYNGLTTAASKTYYRNGAVTAKSWSQAGTGSTAAAGNLMMELGGESGSANFTGLMDEVLVYDRPLTGPEISNVYNDYQSCL